MITINLSPKTAILIVMIKLQENMQIAKNITYLLLSILTLLVIKHYRHIALAVIYDDNETKTARNKLIGDWVLVKKQGFSDNSIKTKENLAEVTYFKYFSRGSNDFIPDPYIIKAYNSTSEIKYFRNRVFLLIPMMLKHN
jgi:hypothetical protein